MIKVQRQFLLYALYVMLACNTVGSVTASETAFFDRKDDDFWIIKDKKAFTEVARTLIDEQGNWKGEHPVPQYIKFSQELTKEDLPTLEKWLLLKGLTCFAIADFKDQPNIGLILNLYLDARDKGEDLETRNLSKLAWINFEESVNEVERGEQSVLPEKWVETNRLFQLKNSHYSKAIASN